MLKKSLLVTLVLIMATFGIFLTGCAVNGSENNNLEVNAIKTQTDEKLSAEYDYWSGTRTYQVNIPDVENFHIRINIKTEEGDIGLKIYKIGSDSYDYQGSNLQTCEFSVGLKDSGKYEICVQGSEHKGGYCLEFSEKVK